MQRRWEEQLAAYVRASFRVSNLGNWASQSIQLINKLVTARDSPPNFEAKAVISGRRRLSASWWLSTCWPGALRSRC